MKKDMTYFGPEGTTVLSSCLVIYCVSLWLLNRLHCHDFERYGYCKVHPYFKTMHAYYRYCSRFLNVK